MYSQARFAGILFSIIFGSLGEIFSQGQAYSTLQNVSPPSPEAISFARQNFADVNLYAGKHGYSIPLYTIGQNGINFPITLSYTGGGGIKVEEVASSVGLGWSLQYTGVITRSIRGLPDDAPNSGYMYLPGFDSTLFNTYHPSWSLYHDQYRFGRYDAQPDLFMVNAPGVSAMFYINKFKKIVFVEKSDLQVKIKFHPYHETISGFDVVDLNGNTYVFNVIEYNRTVSLDGPPTEYNQDDASAWYLSEIKDPRGDVVYTFQYDPQVVETTQQIRSPYQYTLDNQHLFREDNTTYTMLYNKRPRLKKITTASGELTFVMSQNYRRDFDVDRAIDSIVVKNYLGQTIRKFNFEYSYFTETGVVSEAVAQGFPHGDHSLRLKLDALEIIGDDGVSKEAYGFVYNTSKLLPNRLTSFSMDHWGYYNGITTNTTWEGRHRELYYTVGEYLNSPPTSHLREFGTANREPNATYAQACILKEVTTPMGGKIQFEYEGNASNHPELPNNVSQQFVFSAVPGNQKNYFSVNMIREPFAFVRITSPTSSGAAIEYTLQDSLEDNPPIIDTLMEGSSIHNKMLQNGTYYLTARVVNPSPDPDYYYDLRLYRDVETLVFNKPVGGVRIKRMNLINPALDESYVRDYYYNEEGTANSLSPSTGVIARVPKYGYQHIELFSDDYVPTATSTFFPSASTYVRQLSSTYPLVASGGSYAGYSKVTTVDSDSLKSEYHYTTFSEFPEFADGYWKYTGTNAENYQFESGGGYINGTWYEFMPKAPTDERDYFRGKLIKEIQYKNELGVFKKISSTENKYIFNYRIFISKNQMAIGPDSVKSPDSVRPADWFLPGQEAPMETLEGLILTVPATCPGCSQIKPYRLYTGKYDVQKTIQKTFVYTGTQVDSLVQENTLEYGHSPWYKDSYHYTVTKMIQQTNTGTDTTFLYYPFDWRYANPNISMADTSFLRRLEKQNRIGTPFLQKQKSGATHVATVKNLYANFNTDHLNPSTIQVKNGGQATFEDRILFNRYDTLGNILEQQKTDDQKLSYLWGYKNTYVIAQAVNATYDNIAYTSFEPDSKGNWTFTGSPSVDNTAPTGSYSYSVSGTITKSGLGTGKFIVSYWKKSGSTTVNGISGVTGETINGWTYYGHSITNPASGTITISGTNAVIDELRLYPEGAQLTTYTYEPLVGITSQNDQNSLITKYKYDPFGRLTLIKDHRGNVLQQTQYRIVNSVTD